LYIKQKHKNISFEVLNNENVSSINHYNNNNNNETNLNNNKNTFMEENNGDNFDNIGNNNNNNTIEIINNKLFFILIIRIEMQWCHKECKKNVLKPKKEVPKVPQQTGYQRITKCISGIILLILFDKNFNEFVETDLVSSQLQNCGNGVLGVFSHHKKAYEKYLEKVLVNPNA
jgi:hypothetical protein